jgi:3-hydroxyisobutyrate dehydrogenase-like beta-hydroxyacid dehydrogenase
MLGPTVEQLVGFIGLGQMGGRMARRLLDAGYELAIRDVDPAAVKPFEGAPGVRVCASAREVAASGPSPILLSLTLPAVVEGVVLGADGIVAGAQPGQTVIDLSTTGRRTARRLAAELPKHGLSFLEAPVSGGVDGAAQGSLSVMVAGEAALLEQHRALLSVIGRQIFYLGAEPGLGQTMKLVNNILSCSTVAATAEALAVAVKAGIDPHLALDVLNVSTGRSHATQEKFPKRLGGRLQSGFALAMAYKDVKLFLEEAEELGVPALVTPATVDMLRFATSQGLGPDVWAIIDLVENLSGARLR